MGLVGQNGTGKTTLMNIINDRVSPDACDIQWQRGLKIGYLDQHAEIEKDISIFDFLKKAFGHLYEVEQKLNTLYGEMGDSISDDVADKVERYQNQLMYSGFYDLEATILKIASGLGIVAIGVDKKLSEISGGQRAKVILAKLLLEDPDVLLLDEPTNFLDKEHVS
jgi:ATPase subunit of ABC transporter with duplicated ATPase domains